MVERRLIGATGLVTGASSGIGQAIAKALAVRGAKLLLAGRNVERLNQTAAMIAQLGEPGEVAAGDLNDMEFLERLCERTNVFSAGRLSILVCCAGCYDSCRVEESTGRQFDTVFGTNVRAPFLLTGALLPALRAAHGDIVLVNSSAVVNARPGIAAYAASKAALRMLADCLRYEINPEGVRVLSVFPGRTATPLQASLFQREGRTYRPELLLQSREVAEAIVASLMMPRTAELTELHIRPGLSPEDLAPPLTLAGS
jgi:NAD(P)-dependent dehydrogenase (short-subunit alcohol dehydrogenase family)